MNEYSFARRLVGTQAGRGGVAKRGFGIRTPSVQAIQRGVVVNSNSRDVVPLFDPAAVAERVAAGFWPNRTIYTYLREAARRAPAKCAIVDGAVRLNYAELLDLTERAARGLYRLGVRPGDVVSIQLPNWYQFPVLEYALARLGAVCNPLPVIYRAHELRFMLALVRPKVFVVPQTFRGHDHVAMARGLEVPGLAALVVVGGSGGSGTLSFDDLLSDGDTEIALPDPDDVDANAPSEIVFTSGTTGEPKGVVHTHNTNFCPLLSLISQQGLGADEVVLMASTFGHQTGFLYGGQLPILLGGTLVLLDRWDAGRALQLMNAERVTWMMGATPFLQDLLDTVRTTGRPPGTLRVFLCSGAPIPHPLLVEAKQTTRCSVVCGWGMTEVGLVTLGELDDDLERIAGTDGHPLRGMSVKVADDAGNPLIGHEGELLCRGPSLFGGYFRRASTTAESFTADGWFRTGDRAVQGADGYIRITGRSKDIIVRGGENIPVVEIEDVLHRHPKIARAAIVAMPDPRLQERACAFIVPRPGAVLTFDEMCGFLTEQQVARQYHPERLEIAEELPTTPSGKIQKFQLRRQIAEKIERELQSGRTLGRFTTDAIAG